MIFILGIDALDYELVNKWDLINLKQLEYSKIQVPINKKVGLPLSSEVWASFLVGEYVSINLKSSSNFINVILDILYAFNIDLYDGVGKKIQNILKTLGLSYPARIKDLNLRTFIDNSNAKEINAPYYSFDHSTINTLFNYNKGKISINQLIEKINLIYEKRKLQILNEVDDLNNIDVVFSYIHAIDILQHLLYDHISEIKKYYVDLDEYVAILKSKLNIKLNCPIFIIVSDHGFNFEIANHSKWGYYSSNINLMPKPKKITDFYKFLTSDNKY